MADEVKNGLSADPSRIASKWNRSTVADGSWLQKYTLNPLTARDYYLASAIDALGSATDDTTSALSAAISSVSSIHDEYINYLSATISGDISGYIDYVSGSVTALSSEFKTSANAISSKLDTEIQRATEVEEVLQSQINLINASTDVINVYGSYGGVNGFSVESAYYFDPAKTATYHLTNNDIIKIINDEYTPVEETGQTTTGHQTYYQWINNEGITGDPQSPSDGSWNFIGYTEPYYNIAEVNNKFTDISGTIADNYLSAKGAVHQGKNIVVTEDSTKPEITISTSANVEFTNVSSTNISATNVTALTAQGNSANFTNVTATNVTATNIQGTQANYTNFSGSYLTGVNGNNTVTATISGLINSASEGGAMTGIHNISELEFRYQEGSHPEEIITDLATSADRLVFLPSNGCENWLTFSKESYSPEHHEQVININAPNFVRLIDAKLDTFDFTDWSGSTASLFSGTSRSAKSANSATNAYSATTAYAAQNVGNVGSADLIGSAESGYIAYSAISGAKWSANSTNMGNISAGMIFSAGEGVGFNTTNNRLTISAVGKTYAAGDYISITGNTNKINVTGTLINSAQSGQSAYNWITTKSATLQAGEGISFYSAGPNILGIRAEGTKVSAGGNINNPTEYTTNVNLSAGGGVQFVTADNDVLGIKTSTMEYSPFNYSTYYDITSFKINAVAVQGTQQLESVVIVNDRVYGFLMPEPDTSDNLKIPVARYANGRGYYYLDNVSAAIGNYVSAANQQQITVATATTLPSPASMENGVYYIV